MTPEQFAYWLQGHVELNPDAQPTAEQWAAITAHLQTVFVKVTPPMPVSTPGLSKLTELMRSQDFRTTVTC